MISKIKNPKTKTKEQVVIIGGGGHARVLVDILRLCSCKIIGYTDKERQRKIDIDYLGNDDVLASKKYLPSKVKLVNGVGSVRLPVERQKIYEKFKTLGYRFSSVIHPQAIILPSAKLAEGAQVMAGAVIGTGATIGENAIVNTSSSIDHDCVIGAHTHVAPGVTISGGVTIGKACHIGTGAKIIQGVLIGDNVFVLAGAVVVEDVKSNEIGRSIYHRAISEDRDLK